MDAEFEFDAVSLESDSMVISASSSNAKTLLIAAPLYRSPELIGPLFNALSLLSDEIAALGAQIVLINDSPDDLSLRSVLAAQLPSLRRRIGVELLVNPVNLGFVGSANRALRLGWARHADVILLNSDALPTPGAFAEMAAVARTDPMISVVSPRSNNATLCNSPYPDSFRRLSGAAALRAHMAVAEYLPRVTYVPTAVGFCLYVRWLMIEEFGVFDDIYGGGYNEENDFIMRCNRAGYRAVLANHAFVHHLGSVSFSQSDISSSTRERTNSLILRERYPHYDPAVRRYFAGVEYRTQWLLAGLVPDASGRLKVLLDGRNIGAFHNGTFEHTRKLIRAFVKAHGDEFAIHLVCSASVAAFHGFDQITGLSLCVPERVGDEPFAVVFRIAQPFRISHLTDLGELSPLPGFLFLDTISMDCLDLDTADHGRLWSLMAQTIAMIGFNSRFTEQQFRRRFELASDVVDFVSMCSTDPAEYSQRRIRTRREGYILIVGNHYAHKHVTQTIARLRAHTDKPLVVLGGPAGLIPDARMKVYKAGEVEQSIVDGLYDGADVVVFPSHYEGFGLPILQALARGKPVIGRDIPPSREIEARCGDAVNLHLYETTEQMAQAAASDLAWREPSSRPAPWTWADAAQSLRDAILKAVERCDYTSVRARVVRLDALAQRAPAEEEVARPASQLTTAVSLGQLQARARGVTAGAGEGAPLSARGGKIEVELGVDESDLILTTRLLRAADDLGEFDSLVLDIPFEAFSRERARLLLISAGLAPDDGEQGEDRQRIVARPFVRWAETVDFGGDDLTFIENAYKAALGRSSDPGGRANYLGELAGGLDRRAMLISMFASRERLHLVAQMHGYVVDAYGAISPVRVDTLGRLGVGRVAAAA